MPEITTDTPRTTITIAEKTFSVPQPYASGHVLNANEASALNQTYAENIRNNRAKLVKEAVTAGSFNQEVFQASIDDYCTEYEFGVRTGGTRSSDPVMAEAMSIARDLVRKAIVKQGKALKDYTAGRISELAKNQLAKTDDPKTAQIMALARSRVSEAEELTVDVDAGEADAPAEAPAKQKKGETAAAA